MVIKCFLTPHLVSVAADSISILWNHAINLVQRWRYTLFVALIISIKCRTNNIMAVLFVHECARFIYKVYFCCVVCYICLHVRNAAPVTECFQVKTQEFSALFNRSATKPWRVVKNMKSSIDPAQTDHVYTYTTCCACLFALYAGGFVDQ